MAFDYIFKRMMRDLLPSCDARVEKVGDLPLEIDMVVHCQGTMPGPFSIPLLEQHFSRENLFEYKSRRDKHRQENMSKLLGYIGLYCDQHYIGIDEMRSRLTAWYITAIRPAFLDELFSLGLIAGTGTNGFYEVEAAYPCPCCIVVCDELDMNDDNIPLLFLGSTTTIRGAIHQLAGAAPGLRQAMRNVLILINLYYRDEVKDMTELDEILPADIRQNIRHAIEDMGLAGVELAELIEGIGLDKIIEAVGWDKIIDDYGEAKIKDALARHAVNKKKWAK